MKPPLKKQSNKYEGYNHMAQQMQKFVAFIEMQDGTEFGPVRIGLKTKIQAEKSARANNWTQERDGATLNAFMAWHAAKEVGEITLTWDEFLAHVFDANTVELDKVEGETDAEDPTQTAATAG